MMQQSSPPRSWRARRAALLSVGALAAIVACAAPSADGDQICTPRVAVFCRCLDRERGEKVCRDDGRSYGECVPCERPGNPEGPLEPGDPGSNSRPRPQPPSDAGPDAPVIPSGCPDGVVQAGEDCDDGDDEDDDGCSTRCKLSGRTPPQTNACPGLEVHVWGGEHAPTFTSTTAGAGNRKTSTDCTSPIGTTNGVTAPDRVFKVIPHKSGELRVATTDQTFNVFLWASETCEPHENTLLACGNASATATPETMTFPVEADHAYFVFVDGAGTGNYEGEFRVTFSIL